MKEYRKKIFEDKELRTEIKSMANEAIGGAKGGARDFASKGLPLAIGDNIDKYITSIKADFTEIIHTAISKNQASENDNEEQEEQRFVKNTLVELRTKLTAKKSHLRTIIMDLKGIVEDFSWRRYYKILGLAGVFILVEFLVDGTSLQSMNFNPIVAYCVGAGLSLATVVFSHYQNKIMQRFNSRNKRILVFAIISVLVALLYTGLAYFRIEVLQAENFGGQSQDSHTLIKIISFVFFNLFMFWAISVMFYMNSPSKEDILKYDKKKMLEKQKKQLEKEIAFLEQEIKSKEKEEHQIKLVFEKHKQFSKDMMNWINSLYISAIGAFKSENLLSRSDNMVPDCFEQDITDLPFSNKKINNYEKVFKTKNESSQI